MSPDELRPASLRGSEVVCVREEAPPVRSGEELVARPGVSDHAPVRVERIPVHGREDGVLAELASVNLKRRPPRSVRRRPIGGDSRGEVIPHGVAVWHVDRFPPPDSKERPETEVGHTFHIEFRITAGVLVEKQIDRGGHERTVAAAVASVNLESRA